MIAEQATSGAQRSAPIGVPAFSLEPIERPATIASHWRELEARADASFFQSWDWIGPWLDCLPPERRAMLATGRLEGRIIALAILVAGRRRGFGLRPLRVLHLNDSSEPDERSPTVEYNGLLQDRAAPAGLSAGFAAWLLDGIADELVLPGVPAELSAAPAGGLLIRAIEQPAPFVALPALRQAGYLAALSANSRAQIRRALRHYAAVGPVALRQAETPAEAEAFLDGLAALHQRSWTARGRPGAFASPFFRRFHHRLIADGFSRGAIQLVRVTAGTQEIGYLYNLVRDGRIAAYQSGFAYESNPRAKPGLVCHALAIEHNLRQGAARYDFLAGFNQMKQSLATNKEKLVWVTLQNRRFGAYLERYARYLKSHLK
jgi:CelD/BcsL family acetyltransferase involved in cellulose biosynthesis